MKYSIGWIFATWALLISGSVTADDNPPYKLTKQDDHYRPSYGSVHTFEGRFVFSQYGASGNAFDVVSLDPATLEPKVLVTERKEARLVVADKRFLVIQQKGDVARPVVVLDAVSGRELGRVRLFQGVSWGRIDGDRLMLIQGSLFGGGQSSESPALIYSLPGLKLIQSGKIVGGNGAQSWKDTIVSLGADMALYDLNFQRLGTIPLPPAAIRGNSSCGRRLQLVAGDRAFITNGCGVINVIDLASRSLVRAIEGPANFYHLQVVGGLLFAARADDGESPEIRVYDPTSGELVAQLPIDASSGMFAVEGRLIAEHRTDNSYSRSTLQSFEIDAASMRGGVWQDKRVRTECIEAQRSFAKSDDVYVAIERCEAGGINSLIGSTEDLTPAARALVLAYATWLSQTFDRASEALRILAWLAETGTPLEALAHAKLDATVHRKLVLGTTQATTFDASELHTDLGRLIRSNAYSLSTTTRLDYKEHSLVMDGEFAYAHRYTCQAACDTDGPTLMIYDRASMTQLAALALPIVSEDGESERVISSIAADEQHIYVAVEDHWDSPKSNNLLVLDKRTRKITSELLVPMKAQNVQIINGTLVVCHCEYGTCQSIARPTFELAPHAFVSCPSVVPLDSPSLPLTRVPGFTSRWRFTRLNGAGPAEIDLRQTAGNPLVNDTATAAVFLEMHAGWSLVYADLENGDTRTLLRLPRGDAMPILTLHDSTLMVAYGRDLLLIDLRSKKLSRYLQSLVPGGFKDNGNGVDLNKITELVVDDDRLIVKTFSGANSTVVRLEKLLH